MNFLFKYVMYGVLFPAPHPPTCMFTCTCTVEYGQYQKAGELGERYEDFRVLVHLCEKMGSRGQLRDYMTRFSDRVRSGHIVT